MVNYKGPPPPPGTLRRRLWEWSLKIDAAFALNLIDQWEKYLVISLVVVTSLIFWMSLITYYPGHLAYLARRVSYYLFGDESISTLAVARDSVGSAIVSAWNWLCEAAWVTWTIWKSAFDSGFGWGEVMGDGGQGVKTDL